MSKQDYLKQEEFDGGRRQQNNNLLSPKNTQSPRNQNNKNYNQERRKVYNQKPNIQDEVDDDRPPVPTQEEKLGIIKMKKANHRLRTELKKMSKQLTQIIEKNQYKYSGVPLKRKVEFNQKMLEKEIATAKKQLIHYTNKTQEMQAKEQKGGDVTRVSKNEQRNRMILETIGETRVQIKNLKKMQWQNERNLKKANNEEDYNQEMKQYINSIKAYQGRIKKVKDRRRLDEHNTKKVEEKINIVTDKYQELCQEHSVVSSYKNTNDVMKVLQKKEKPSYQRRRDMGQRYVKKIYNAKGDDFKKENYTKLFDQKDNIPNDYNEETLFELKKTKQQLIQTLEKAKKRKVKIIKIEKKHVQIQKDNLQIVSERLNDLSELCKDDVKLLLEAKDSLETDKQLIEKNMQLINWVTKDKARHPYYRENNKKIDKKYQRKLRLIAPEKDEQQDNKKGLKRRVEVKEIKEEQMGQPKNEVKRFTDRDVLKQIYNTKIVQVNVYKIKTEKGVKLTGIQAFYRYWKKGFQWSTLHPEGQPSEFVVMPGLEMVIPNKLYEVDEFKFDEDDYLKRFTGSIDKDKNFVYLKFKSAKGKIYECGSPGKYNRKVNMEEDQRPICLKLALKPVEGKVDKQSLKRKIIGSTIVVIGCDFIQDSIDEEIRIKEGEYVDEEKDIQDQKIENLS